ncbi:MAG: hypothetical protein GX458_20675 [Phyllobacteriaceae bacterium]|nr:hypothetical protein [Phyllobacteriaceae bacterium]
MPLADGSPILAYLRRLGDLPPPAPRREVGWGFAFAVFAAAFAVLAFDAPTTLADPDTPWHIASGASILATGRFPTVDEWSWTIPGTPWIAKEWLSQVILATAFRLGGWAAVAAVTTATAALAVALVARETARRLTLPVAALLVAAILPLSINHLFARPHVFAWVPLVIWSIGLLRAAEDTRAPRPILLAAMVIWTNLHGSFLFGLGLVPILAVEALLRAEPARRLRLALAWAAFLGAAVVSTLLHPYGIGVWRAAFAVMNLSGLQTLLYEWLPQNFAGFNPVEGVILAAIGLLATTGVRLPAVRVGLLLLLLHMTIAHIRHTELLGLVGVLVLAEPLAAVGASAGLARARTPLALLLAGAVALAGAGASYVVRPYALPADHTPTAALAAVRSAAVPGEVLNAIGFGGWLITEGVKTWSDGRIELFGASWVNLYRDGADLRSIARFDELFSDPRIGWTLLPPSLPAVALLDRTPGWKRFYADDVAVVHVRVPR